MDFTKKQIHLIPAFWFQKDEVEETQVCFESISLKSPFALWTLFVPVWRRAGQHVIHAMVVMAHKEHLSPSHLHYTFILLGWKTYQRTKTMTEKYFIVCGSKGKRYVFFFPLWTVQTHSSQFCSLVHGKLYYIMHHINSVHKYLKKHQIGYFTSFSPFKLSLIFLFLQCLTFYLSWVLPCLHKKLLPLRFVICSLKKPHTVQ